MIIIKVCLGEHGQPELLEQLIIGQRLAREKAEASGDGLEHEDQLSERQFFPALEVEDVEEDYVGTNLHCSL